MSDATVQSYCARRRPLLLLAGGNDVAAGRRADGRHRRCRCGRAHAGSLEPPDDTRLRAASEGVLLASPKRAAGAASGLAAGIMAPRFMADETVPKGVRREDVLRLLASVQGDRPVDKRDRAILMLFIAYGLRAGEVGGLRLDDLDWENEMIRVRCPKPGRTHVWPLSPGVGQCHSPLHTGSPSVRLRAQPLLHIARADPAARQKDPRQDRP